MENIIDITSDHNNKYESVIKAEQKENNILILRKLETPRKTWSKGPMCHYSIEYRWLNPSTGGVLGNEFTLWNKKKVSLNKSLFEQFNLIS